MLIDRSINCPKLRKLLAEGANHGRILQELCVLKSIPRVSFHGYKPPLVIRTQTCYEVNKVYVDLIKKCNRQSVTKNKRLLQKIRSLFLELYLISRVASFAYKIFGGVGGIFPGI